MKKKVFKGMVLTAAMTMAMGTTVFAAGWKKNATGWWYATNDAGTSWYANEWQWIDGDGDGIGECYYFDQNGFMVMNTVTADGSVLGAGGAWTVNGVVQTKQMGTAKPAENTKPAASQTNSATPKGKLADIKPDYEASVDVLEDSYTAGGEDWKGTIRYRRGNGQEYARADYYLGGAYQTLKFKAAPYTKSFGNNDIVALTFINQETGEELYRQGGIMADTHVFEGTVDVSGVKYLRVDVSGDTDYEYDGWFGYLLVDADLYE